MPRDRQIVPGRPITTPAGIADKNEAEALVKRLRKAVADAETQLARITSLTEAQRLHATTLPIDHPDASIPAAKLDFDPATQAELNTHTGDTSNPHAVTLQQVVDEDGNVNTQATFNGNIQVGGAGDQIGFFGAALSTKATVALLAALAATASFGDVDARLEDIRVKLNALLGELHTKGLIGA